MGSLSTAPTDLSATLPHPTPGGLIESVASRGRTHPDVDELRYLVDGAVEIELDEEGGEPRVVALTPGDAFVVPRGIWHRTLVREPCRLLFTSGESRARSR